MKIIAITALAALAGFFACNTTKKGAESSLQGDESMLQSASQTMSMPAAEALLTALYGD
jgi:hypothetical protein